MKPDVHYRKYTIVYYLLILATLAFLFFTNDFGIVDIQKSAIVMGIGIDPDEEGFLVTTQLAVPKHSDTGQQTESVEVQGKGKTVAEAITKINGKTGWYPKLIFCDLVILSEELVQQDIFCVIDYFLRNENMNDNAQLAVCRGRAEDFFATKTPTDDMSTVAVRKVLSEESQRAGQTVPTTLREFAIGYYGEAQTGFMPLIERVPQAKSLSPSGGSSNQDSAQSKQSQPETEYVFNASQTLLFSRGKAAALLNAEQTLAFSLFENEIRLVTLTVEENGIQYSVGIRYTGHREEAKTGTSPEFDMYFYATAQTVDTDVANSIEDISGTLPPNKSILRAAERKLSGLIYDVVTISRDADCDVFGIADKFQKFHPFYSKDYDDLFHAANVNISVALKNLK